MCFCRCNRVFSIHTGVSGEGYRETFIKLRSLVAVATLLHLWPVEKWVVVAWSVPLQCYIAHCWPGMDITAFSGHCNVMYTGFFTEFNMKKGIC